MLQHMIKSRNFVLGFFFSLSLVSVANVASAHGGDNGPGNGGSWHRPQPMEDEVLLDAYKSNGSVAPHFHVWWDCKISTKEVTITSGNRGTIPAPIVKEIGWTPEVPDARAILDLLGKARAYEVSGHPRPIGGGYSFYEGYVQGENILLSPVDQYGWGNRSNEAAILVTFVNQNCQSSNHP